jgi:hypothetical protein
MPDNEEPRIEKPLRLPKVSVDRALAKARRLHEVREPELSAMFGERGAEIIWQYFEKQFREQFEVLQ